MDEPPVKVWNVNLVDVDFHLATRSGLNDEGSQAVHHELNAKEELRESWQWKTRHGN